MTIINKICFAAASFICLLTLMGAGCAGNAGGVKPPEKPVIEVESNKDQMWKDLVKQVDFGPRVPGTQAHLNTRDWIIASLVPNCDSVKTQQFSHVLGGKNITMWNVIANINGKGAESRDKVLLAAHWDTRPKADQDLNIAKQQTPIDGANDGASGVAILLEIARMVKNHPIDRDVELVFFDGEDYGPDINNMLLGSAYYAKNMVLKPNWGILLDMVGDADLTVYKEPNSEKLAKFVNDKIFRAALNAGYIRTG
ncbi:MAG: M28 family peptidase, partial [bacterium]